ncbi:MAG: serine protease [Chloroflexi bacterium]|nr:serine protease [Chloroflexota bacterium]
MHFRRDHIARAIVAVVSIVGLLACSPDVDIDATIDSRVHDALAAQATVTPQPTPSPQATVTPITLPIPRPTATPAATATPAPTATPQPEPTLVATATPQPTATPMQGFDPTPTALPVVSDLYASVRLSVVRIRNGNSIGSGWAIEDGWIITNEHVVNGASSVIIEIPLANGGVATKTGTVRGFDTKRDLAAVQINHGADVLPTRVITVNDAGIPIIQLGYSVIADGGFPVVHQGVVTTVIRHLGNVLDDAAQRADEGDDTAGVGIVVFDADADPGDSGGPVLNLQGEVVGITFGAVVSTGGGKRVIGQQMATSVESILRVWEQLKSGVNTSGI